MLSTDVTDHETLSDEDRELIQNIDENLEQQKLLKTFSVPKLASSLKALLTAVEFPNSRCFTSSAVASAARDKFVDPKGMSTLSTTVQLYLNIDLDEFREESGQHRRRKLPSLGLLKKTKSHFKCSSNDITL